MTRGTEQNTTARAVNIRLRDDVRNLIDRAAKSLGKTRTDFMIDASRRAAEDALLDQTFIHVDSESFEALSKVLDTPAAGEGHDRLMNASKPWK